jgi:hypothetical protein
MSDRHIEALPLTAPEVDAMSEHDFCRSVAKSLREQSAALRRQADAIDEQAAAHERRADFLYARENST